MADRVLNVRITGDASKLTSSMKQAGKATESFGVKTGPLRSRLGGLHESVKAVALGFAGFEVVKKGAEFLVDATKAAMDDQVQMANVANAAKNAGISWKAHGKAIDETLTSMSNASGFMKGDLANSFGRLITATHSTTKSTSLLSDAENVARARHIDLQTATQLLIKTNMGNVGALSRYGIATVKVTSHVDALKKKHLELVEAGHKFTAAETANYQSELVAAKAADKQATAIASLNLIHKTYAGASQRYSKTAEGSIKVLQARWENFQIELGNKMLPTLAKVATALATNLPKAIAAATPPLDRLKAKFASDMPQIEKNARTTTTNMTNLWNRWGSTVKTVTAAALDQARADIKTKGKLGVDAFSIIANTLTGRWGAAWGSIKALPGDVFASVKQTMIGQTGPLGREASKLASAIESPIMSALNSIASTASSVFSSIASAAAHAASLIPGSGSRSNTGGGNTAHGHTATSPVAPPHGHGGRQTSSARATSAVVVHVHVAAVAGVTAKQLAEVVRTELVARQRRNGTAIAPGIA